MLIFVTGNQALYNWKPTISKLPRISVKYTLSPKTIHPKIKIKTVAKYVRGKYLDIAILFIASEHKQLTAVKIKPFEKQYKM